MLRKIIFSFLVVVIAMPALVGSAKAAGEITSATTLQENLQNIVYIECGYYDYDDEPTVYASGSGVVLDDGIILTNAHVAYDAYAYESYDEVYEGGDCSTPDYDISCGQTVTGNNYDDGYYLLDYYGCYGTTMSGPEVIYTLELSETTEVTMTLENINNEADLGFYVIGDSGDDLVCTDQCLVDGDWSLDGNEQETEVFEAGTYYISVDGWDDAIGDYSLNVECDDPSGEVDPVDDEIYDYGLLDSYYDGDTLYEIYEYDFCVGGVTSSSYQAPTLDIVLVPDTFNFNNQFDYAFMTAYDEDGYEYNFPQATTYGNADSLVHGDTLDLIGYPAVLGTTITSTSGTVSGFDGTDWIISDAITEFGNSGGGAFDVNGNLIGIPSAVIQGELNSFSLVQNLNAILENAFSFDFVDRDYSTLYTMDNVICFGTGECYQFGEGVDDIGLSEEAGADDFYEGAEDVPFGNYDYGKEYYQNDGTPDPYDLPAQYDPNQYDSGLVSRLLGYILLQVESHGEAWYINPADSLRYYMASGSIAYEMMRSFGLGITDADLAGIPSVESTDAMLVANDVCSTNSLANRLKGQILLQVEQNGEAWYVYPDNCQMIYMKDGDAAYEIMRFLGLGITNNDLVKMPMGIID